MLSLRHKARVHITAKKGRTSFSRQRQRRQEQLQQRKHPASTLQLIEKDEIQVKQFNGEKLRPNPKVLEHGQGHSKFYPMSLPSLPLPLLHKSQLESLSTSTIHLQSSMIKSMKQIVPPVAQPPILQQQPNVVHCGFKLKSNISSNSLVSRQNQQKWQQCPSISIPKPPYMNIFSTNSMNTMSTTSSTNTMKTMNTNMMQLKSNKSQMLLNSNNSNNMNNYRLQLQTQLYSDQYRLFSNNSKNGNSGNNDSASKGSQEKSIVTGWESSGKSTINMNANTNAKINTNTNIGSSDNSGSVSGNGNGNGAEILNALGLDRKRFLVSLAFLSAGATIVASPIILRSMKKSDHEYNEVEIEEELYRQVKELSSETEGELTRRILGDELTQKIMDGSRQKAVANTSGLISDVLNSDALQNAITSLLTSVVKSKQFQSACQMLLKNLWDDLIHDPETTAQVIALLNTAIQDEKVKQSFKELILGLLEDEDVYRELTGLVVKLGEEKQVLDATRELLTESAHRALNDPEILDHSMEFATDVVGDNVLQRTSGEALRNTVTYAVKPSLSTFLSVFGIALLFFSASALGNARISARQGREMDAALSVVAKSISHQVMTSVSRILSLPKRAVTGLTSAILATVLYPFHLVGSAALAIGQAGNAALNTLINLFETASSFPTFVQQAMSISLTALQKFLSNAVHRSYSWMSSLPGMIALQGKVMIQMLGESIVGGSKSLGSAIYASLISMLTSGFSRISTGFEKLTSASRSKASEVGAGLVDVLSRLMLAISARFQGGNSDSSATATN